MQKRIIKYVHNDYLIKQADKNPAVKCRATLTHELIKWYDLLQHMEIISPKMCNIANLRGFHSQDYVQQLERFNSLDVYSQQQQQQQQSADTDDSLTDDECSGIDEENISDEFGLGFDCPTWPSLKEYVRCIAGATMTACQELCKSNSMSNAAGDIIINWTGGWHHAHRDKAAGYCYVNDIVLGILVLRKCYQRILYIDLDVHHGDGVQEAFETTKRVFTLSFHQHECGFYPGSGAADDYGFANGRGYAANFPYQSGITGEQFTKYFKKITSLIFDCFQPDVCIVQCGADVIVGDPLGGTNLTPDDLIDCLSLILNCNLPTIFLGGGGYHFSNASRFWTLVTAKICNKQLNEDVPVEHPNFLAFGPDYSLNIKASKYMTNLNNDIKLENSAKIIEENLLKYKVGAFK